MKIDFGAVGYILTCRKCKGKFTVHAHCYRGQTYCSKSCRIEGLAVVARQARRRYMKSPAALRLQRLRQNRYRQSLKKKRDASIFHFKA
jgi:hypothetical protein